MLQRSRAHWHGQRSALRSADQRGLIGVQGIERRQVMAEMRWEQNNNSVSMLIYNARPRPAHMRAATLIQGLAPLQPTIVLDGLGDEDLLIINDVHNLEAGYFLALMFQEPIRMVGPRTGASVLLLLPREGDLPRPYVVGDLFPLEHGVMRYIICPDDNAICRTAHVAESTILDAILEPGPVPVVVAVPTPIPVGTQVRGAAGFQDALLAAQEADRTRRPRVRFVTDSPTPEIVPPLVPPAAAVPTPAENTPRSPRIYPWAYLGESPLSRLCGRLSLSDIAVIERWDDLAMILSNGAVPLYARTPRDMLPPRFEFVHSILEEALQQVPPASQDGWPGVFLSARVFMRATARMTSAAVPAAPTNGAGTSSEGQGGVDLASSFGARHAQVAFFSPAQGAAQTPSIDTQFNISTRSAAAFVHADGTGAVVQGLAALHALTNQALTEPQSSSERVIRALGEQLASGHPSLQVLQQAGMSDGPLPINQLAGAQLNNACTQLGTSSAVFLERSATALRDFICLDDPKDTPVHREDETKLVMKNLLKGKPLLISERQIVGREWGGMSLFASLKVVPLTPEAFLRAKDVLRYLSYAVLFFWRPPDGEVDFFLACIRKLDVWHREQRDIAKAAIVFETIMASMQAATTRHFESISLGGSLLRPRYSERLFTSPDGARALEAFLSPMSISEEVERVVQAQFRAHMGHVATHSALVMGQAYAPPAQQVLLPPIPPVAPQGQLPAFLQYAHALMQASTQAAVPLAPALVAARPKKRDRKPAQTATPAVAAAAPAPQAPHVRLNLAGIIGGPPHLGTADIPTMAAFSAANGNKCFHFWRRGSCKNDRCRFEH